MQKRSTVCPTCKQKEFTIHSSGLFFRKRILTCTSCQTSLQQVSSDEYKILSLGENYSLSAPYHVDHVLFDYELEGQNIASDKTIQKIRQGQEKPFTKIYSTIQKKFKKLPIELHKNEQLAVRLLYLVFATGVESPRPGKEIPQAAPLSSTFMQIENIAARIPAAIKSNQSIGEMIVTDQRITFIGTHAQFEYPITSIKSLVPYKNGLQLLRKEMLPAEFYMNDDTDWIVVGAIIEGLQQTT